MNERGRQRNRSKHHGGGTEDKEVICDECGETLKDVVKVTEKEEERRIPRLRQKTGLRGAASKQLIKILSFHDHRCYFF